MRFRQIPFYLIGVGVSSCVGLILGGFLSCLLAVIALSATGHSDPMSVIDAAFESKPMGSVAFAMIMIYVSASALGGWIGFHLTQRFVRYFYGHLAVLTAASYTERGGATVSPVMIGSIHATWPFARLRVSSDSLQLSVLWHPYSFTRDQIT